MKKGWRLALASLVGLVVTLASYVSLAWLGLFTLMRTFEGRGHPPLPGAPDWLYVTIFLIVAPLLAIGIGVWSGRLCAKGFRGSRRVS